MQKKIWEFLKEYKYHILIPFILLFIITLLIIALAAEDVATPFRYAVQ